MWPDPRARRRGLAVTPLHAAAVEAARRDSLGELVPEVVLFGGASIELWITDPAAPPVRPTQDAAPVRAIGAL